MTVDNTYTNAHAGLARAEACRAAGDLPGAEVILSQVMNTFPDFDPACHARGLLAFEMGNLTLAAQWMARAVALNAGQGLYHRNLGELCRRLGRLEEAVAGGQRASQLLPLDRDAHYNLGLALSDSGNWQAAIASYGRALALRPEHGPSWNNLGVAFERHGQRADAELAFVKAVELNPVHAEAQLNLGMCFKKQGRLQEAQRCFDVVHKIAPGLAEKLGVSVKTTVDTIHPPKICMRDTASVRGRGVFAARDFLAGEVIETAAVVLLQPPFESFPPEIKSICFNWGALCGIGSVQALALGYGSLYNHSNPANTRYEAVPENMAMNYVALRDITSGEELTINYDTAGGSGAGGDKGWFNRMNVNLITGAPG
jgi:tetratricopeptide (TPR) repeat protein